jgi:hypothetical protein
LPAEMARLNFEIPDELHAEVKRLADERGQTLKGLVIYELRRAVQRAQEAGEPFEAGDAKGMP